MLPCLTPFTTDITMLTEEKKHNYTKMPLTFIEGWDLHKKLIFPPTLLRIWIEQQQTHSYSAGHTVSHRWRRNAETSYNSWGPQA